MRHLTSIVLLAVPLLTAGCDLPTSGKWDIAPKICGLTYWGPECYQGEDMASGMGLAVNAPIWVVGTATYDPELLWGTRCEVTVGWSVGQGAASGDSLWWAPGSTITWYESDANGWTGPFTADWDPAEFFGSAKLSPGQGMATAVWVRGNDGMHPHSAPFWKATIAIKYRTSDRRANGEVKTTVFRTGCAES